MSLKNLKKIKSVLKLLNKVEFVDFKTFVKVLRKNQIEKICLRIGKNGIEFKADGFVYEIEKKNNKEFCFKIEIENERMLNLIYKFLSDKIFWKLLERDYKNYGCVRNDTLEYFYMNDKLQKMRRLRNKYEDLEKNANIFNFLDKGMV
jgi:hypothetical protein